MAERAFREKKRHELEQSIGRRSNIFGQVLEDKERMYADTINTSLAADNSSVGRDVDSVQLRERIYQQTSPSPSRVISRESSGHFRRKVFDDSSIVTLAAQN